MSPDLLFNIYQTLPVHTITIMILDYNVDYNIEDII